jgi:aldehyde dehydrogenase (NAD+)
MHTIDHLYINGAFVPAHGTEVFTIVNPSTGAVLGHATLADREDTRRAVAAAAAAFPAFSRTSKAERSAMLTRLHDAVLARVPELAEATIAEYGATVTRAAWSAAYAAQAFQDAATTLAQFDFTPRMGSASVRLEPLGVAALITPWNSNAGSICSKLSSAIAAGCTAVVKPSEMSALQTRILAEALHAAALPPGVINIVIGRGDTVGDELSVHPDVAAISFTGSTAVGKMIMRAAADSMKRVNLALGGKSPTLLLDDADFARAVPQAIDIAFMNNGQACIAGSRLLVPAARMDEVIALARAHVATLVVGDPRDAATTLGPMASGAQFARVQQFIMDGVAEGAELIAGGAGRPEGIDAGHFVRPTVFARVDNTMRIAREEIFGPVLAIIGYRDEEDAVAIANDSVFGLQAYVFTPDLARAHALAARLQAGRVLINGMRNDPFAPFGGVKQSGVGREFGAPGIAAFLDTKAVIVA